MKLHNLFYAFRMLWRKCQRHDTVASLLRCSTVMFARSTCGMIMCVSWTLYFYVFILSTELLFTGCLFAFILVIPESFERKNTPVDDG